MSVTEKDGSSLVFTVALNETKLLMFADEVATRGLSLIEMEGGTVTLTLLPVAKTETSKLTGE